MNAEVIYVDTLKHCHRTDDGARRAVETSFFSGKCNTVVEGYCYDDSKGYARFYPWKPYSQIAAAQAQYEADLAEATAAYQEGVNSAYDQ